ncbi:MAG TPA: cytochrome P450 [Rhizomicrobium sp.]|nr:cytochrome P450 [Rhizomicrobium sp.]
MSAASETVTTRLRPAAPVPHNRNLSTLQVLRELGRNPIAAFSTYGYSERYVHSRTFVSDFLLVSDPDGVRHVLLDNAANYVKSIQAQRLTKPALGNGLVTSEGASWRFQRRTIAPMFALRNVHDFASVMEQSAEAMLARWEGRTELDAADELMQLTYDIISRTLFSNDVAMQYGKMSEALAVYLESQGRIDILRTIGVPNWVPTPNNLRARGPLKFFRKELMALVRQRRAQLQADPTSVGRDFLTMLLTTRDPEGGALFGEAEVFDNVMTFVFAGHETTSNALAWTLYLLSQFPEADARVAEEVARERDLDGLVYTRMVLEESMRLYPPVPIISRDSVGPDVVGPVAIRPKTSVMIAPWLIHRHRTLWEDPEYFDPERFAPGKREKIPRFAYLPFGAGPRICIGMAFAMQEALIILRAILRRYRLELEPGFPVEPQARVTLRPKHGLRMRLVKRASPAPPACRA